MDKNLNYIFNYMRFAKIESIRVDYDYESKYLEGYDFLVKDIGGGYSSKNKQSNFFLEKINKIREAHFSELYNSVSFDVDDLWYIRVEISLSKKTLIISAYEKVIVSEPKIESTYKVENFDKKVFDNLDGYFGDKYTVNFDGSWDEIQYVEVETDQEIMRLRSNLTIKVQDLVAEVMSNVSDSWWNESQGCYGSILIWDDDVFVEYTKRFEEYKTTDLNLVYNYNPQKKSLNENEDSEKSHELTKDQEIAFQKLLVLIKRKFPFIMDLSFTGYGNYFGIETLEINLTVDLEKVKDYYKTDFSETYYKHPYLFDTLDNKESMHYLFTPFKMEDKDELIGFNDKFNFYINKLVNALPTRLRTPSIRVDKFTFKLDTSKYYNAREYFFQNHGFYPS